MFFRLKMRLILFHLEGRTYCAIFHLQWTLTQTKKGIQRINVIAAVNNVLYAEENKEEWHFAPSDFLRDYSRQNTINPQTLQKIRKIFM